MLRLGSRLPRAGTLPALPRLLLAGTCLSLALLSAVSDEPAGDPNAATAPLVVTARPLPAGHLLTRGDLAIARWPSASRPSGARGDPASLVGRRLAGPIGAGELITGSRLFGADLAVGLSPGLVAAAVVLADPHAADLIQAGDRVDLLATARPADPLAGAPAERGDVEILAANRLVLAVLPATSAADAEVVLGVDRPTALRITRDSATHLFTAVVLPP